MATPPPASEVIPAACTVCTERFNKTTRRLTECCYCKYTSCVSCVKRYLLGTSEDPHCMSCRRGWSVEYIDSLLSHAFRAGDLARHRENVLLDRERSMLPATQVYVEADIRNRKYDERLKSLRAEFHALERRFRRFCTRRIRIRNMDPLAATPDLDDVDADTEVTPTGPHPPPVTTTFIKPCPTDGCRGFLSTAYRCGICETRLCSACHEVIVPPNAPAAAENDSDSDAETETAETETAETAETAETEAAGASETGETETDEAAVVPPPRPTFRELRAAHVCNADVVASVRAIASDSKACPKCGAMIFRVSGCAQMYCTVPGCGTAFDFVTGLVSSGRIHNPHYYEFLRRTGNGEVPREPGDAPGGCENDDADAVPPVHALNVLLTSPTGVVVLNLHRFVTHIQRVELYGFPENVQAADALNRDLRVKFMLNKITEAKFKRTVRTREKRRHFNADVRQVLTMVVAVVGNALRGLSTRRQVPGVTGVPGESYDQAHIERITKLRHEMEELRRYANESLATIRKRYNFVVPHLAAWDLPIPVDSRLGIMRP